MSRCQYHSIAPQVRLPGKFPEWSAKGIEHLCSLCSLTGSDITALPLRYTSNSPSHRTVNTDAANEIKFDWGVTVILTVADASGLHESNTQFLFLQSQESSLHLITRLPWRRNGTNSIYKCWTASYLTVCTLHSTDMSSQGLLMHKPHDTWKFCSRCCDCLRTENDTHSFLQCIQCTPSIRSIIQKSSINNPSLWTACTHQHHPRLLLSPPHGGGLQCRSLTPLTQWYQGGHGPK